MLKEDCLFCNIINGTIPSSKVYEDEYVYAFNDINPLAPVHIVIVPKTHISCADEINADNSVYISRIFEAVPKIAKNAGLSNGYRIINNCGPDGAQSVMHLHFHLLGGIKLKDSII